VPLKASTESGANAGRFANILKESWQRRGVLNWVLSPVALSYGIAVGLRRQLFKLGWIRPVRLPCQVLVVGNVIVGGAGKTPTAIEVVRYFHERGWRVGVISRGYGRKSLETLEVGLASPPADVGDEPLVLARAANVPVFVARRRVDAANALLSNYPDTELIVCDDGLQHWELFRDAELCLFDDRGIGNGWLLPAGPLREKWPRDLIPACGQSADTGFVLHTGQTPAFPGYCAHRSLAQYAVDAMGQTRPLHQLANGRPILALAGIAQPERFFSDLRQSGVAITDTLGLPDHVDFAHIDLQAWATHQIVCTEKDAVKLWQFCPDALAVPLRQTMDPDLLAQLQRVLSAKRSARI